MTADQIKKDIDFIKQFCSKLTKILPSFDITDAKILPYGLKAHTRSVSWLVEQVITQQAKFHASELGVDDVDFDMPDTCLHDCIIMVGDKKYYINIKVHNAAGRETRNDIAAVEKLFMQYSANPNYDILYVCFGIHFDNVNISFDKDYISIFSAQFLPIYINPRNDKIQALYNHKPELRTRKDFLSLLQNNSKSIALGKK